MSFKCLILLFVISFLFIFLTPSFASAAPSLIIKDISDSPDPFSPNGDGFQDSTIISATISASGFSRSLPGQRKSPSFPLNLIWELTIRNSQGRIIRKFIQRERMEDNSEIRISQVWDGKDIRRRIVPDGKYTYRIDARIGR